MAQTVINNSDLHFEHETWVSELKFWMDEITSFENRLGELITRYTLRDMLQQLEHFQNEFILHRKRIGEMLEDIEQHEARIAGQSYAQQEVLDVPMAKKHKVFRTSMDTQREIYKELKKDFFRFLSEYF